jgi:hypothetical protein
VIIIDHRLMNYVYKLLLLFIILIMLIFENGCHSDNIFNLNQDCINVFIGIILLIIDIILWCILCIISIICNNKELYEE